MSDDAKPYTMKDVDAMDRPPRDKASLRATAKALEEAQRQAAQMREALEEAERWANADVERTCGHGGKDGGCGLCLRLATIRGALAFTESATFVGPERFKAGLREAWDNGYNFGGTNPYRGLFTEAERRPVYEAARTEDVDRILKGGGK